MFKTLYKSVASMKVTLNLTFFLALLLSGCANEPNLFSNSAAEVSLTKYYLWIKNLDKESLATEVSFQQQQHLNGDQNAPLYLLMLNSLPSSPVHNAYTAKAALNDTSFSQYINEHLSVHDLALITLLKDQLNQQLLQLRAMDKQKKKYARTNAQLQLKLTMHQQAIKSLESKLAQLKTIEAAISKRESN